MAIFNHWRPGKLEEHGFQQISEARNLLETQGANLSPEYHDVAEGLLEE